jgi:ATP-binding cassette subfamily F protein 3
MAALVATSMGVVREVLGDSVVDEVDEPIVDYIANVLADQDFDFGPPDGHGIFDALGELLIDARCVYDQEHCLEVLSPSPRPESHRHFVPSR